MDVVLQKAVRARQILQQVNKQNSAFATLCSTCLLAVPSHCTDSNLPRALWVMAGKHL
jgi:hypothetical protein